MIERAVQDDAVSIALLAAGDYEAWLPLWIGNNQGQFDEAVSETTWARLIDPASNVGGLAAWQGDKMAGLVHYILHPVTGHIEPVCYMQDVYVDPPCRRRGIARKMIETLAAKGAAENWARLYWLAEQDNEAAQALYKNLGLKLDFTLHVMPL